MIKSLSLLSQKSVGNGEIKYLSRISLVEVNQANISLVVLEMLNVYVQKFVVIQS
jgi:hypothetical protein